MPAKITAAQSLARCEAIGAVPSPAKHADRLTIIAQYDAAVERRTAIGERRGVQGRRGRPTSDALRVALTVALAPLTKGEAVTIQADAPYLDGLTLVKSGAFAGTAAIRAACMPVLLAMGLDPSLDGNVGFARTDKGAGTSPTTAVVVAPR